MGNREVIRLEVLFLGGLPPTIAEIPRRRAIKKFAAFSGFVPTNALVSTNGWSANRK